MDHIKLVPGAEDGEGEIAFMLRVRVKDGVMTLAPGAFEYAVDTYRGQVAAYSRYADPALQAKLEAQCGPFPSWPIPDESR